MRGCRDQIEMGRFAVATEGMKAAVAIQAIPLSDSCHGGRKGDVEATTTAGPVEEPVEGPVEEPA